MTNLLNRLREMGRNEQKDKTLAPIPMSFMFEDIEWNVISVRNDYKIISARKDSRLCAVSPCGYARWFSNDEIAKINAANAGK